MGMRRDARRHDTEAVRRHAAARSEEYWEHRPNDRVITIDGPGRVVAVHDGPFPGSEEYEIRLEGGLGGGTYDAGQITASVDTTASVESSEASVTHTAADDYPELGSILADRPDPASLRYTAALGEDPGLGLLPAAPIVEDDEGQVMRDMSEYHSDPMGDFSLASRQHSAARAFEHYHPDQVYLRFGHWPENERSTNNVTGFPEDGVSVYDLDHEGDPMDPDPDLSRGHAHDESCEPDCDLDAWNDDYGNDTREEMNGRVHRAEQARYRGASESHPDIGHLVKGDMVGIGHDGEPLLNNVRRVGDWIDHRHLFVPGAEKHRLARDADDEDYEPPEEHPVRHTAMPSRKHPAPEGFGAYIDRLSHGRHVLVGTLDGAPVGTLDYFAYGPDDEPLSDDDPAETASHVRVRNLQVPGEHHRGKGVASAMMDHLYASHPAAQIDHGDRTEDGKGWWNSYDDPDPARNVTARSINGEEIDQHGSAPGWPRAGNPNVYDEISTEGEPDPAWIEDARGRQKAMAVRKIADAEWVDEHPKITDPDELADHLKTHHGWSQSILGQSPAEMIDDHDAEHKEMPVSMDHHHGDIDLDDHWCQVHQTHHDDPAEADEHLYSGANTDWDQYDIPDEIHRGMIVQLPPHVHDVVHDDSRPHHERAQHLLDHLKGGMGVGMHWSTDEHSAKAFAEDSRQDDGRTRVVMTAATPHRDDFETDPAKMDGAFHFTHEEQEIPLKRGAPLRLKSISWNHRPEIDFKARREDPTGRDTAKWFHPYSHHDFEEPREIPVQEPLFHATASHPDDVPHKDFDEDNMCAYGHEGTCEEAHDGDLRSESARRTAMPSRRYPGHPEGFETRIEPSYRDDDTQNLVGYIDGQRVGHINYTPQGGRTDPNALKVNFLHTGSADPSARRVDVRNRPAGRGKGVASALMDHLYTKHPNAWINHGYRTEDGLRWWRSYEEPAPERNVHNVHPDEGWDRHFDPEDVANDINKNEDSDPGHHSDEHDIDWAQEGHWGGYNPHPTDHQLYRGISIHLPLAAHRLVHNPNLPTEDRARHLLDHIGRGNMPEYDWHMDSEDAHYQARAEGPRATGDTFGNHTPTHVVFHIDPPDKKAIDDEDLENYSGGGGAFDMPGRDTGSRHLNLRGISWSEPNRNPTRHSFGDGEPVGIAPDDHQLAYPMGDRHDETVRAHERHTERYKTRRTPLNPPGTGEQQKLFARLSSLPSVVAHETFGPMPQDPGEIARHLIEHHGYTQDQLHNLGESGQGDEVAAEHEMEHDASTYDEGVGGGDFGRGEQGGGTEHKHGPRLPRYEEFSAIPHLEHPFWGGASNPEPGAVENAVTESLPAGVHKDDIPRHPSALSMLVTAGYDPDAEWKEPSRLTEGDQDRLSRMGEEEARELDPTSDEHEFMWGFRQLRPHEKHARDIAQAAKGRDYHDRDAASRGHEDVRWTPVNHGKIGYAPGFEGECQDCGHRMVVHALSTSSTAPHTDFDLRHSECTGPGTRHHVEEADRRMQEAMQGIVSDFGEAAKDVHESQWPMPQPSGGSQDPGDTQDLPDTVHPVSSPEQHVQRHLFGEPDERRPVPMHTLSLLATAALDRDFRFHVTAAWKDVRAKAKRIRSQGGVHITHADEGVVIGNVKGDHHVYETGLQRVVGKRHSVATYTCGCKWGAYHWGAGDDMSRFAGRMCSHALALQYEAQSRGMFGRDVEADDAKPRWVPSKVVVKYDIDEGRNIRARASRTVPEQPPLLALLANLEDGDPAARVVLAAANDLFGDSTGYTEPSLMNPMGPTSPWNPEENPTSAGVLTAPEPHNWGSISSPSLFPTMASAITREAFWQAVVPLVRAVAPKVLKSVAPAAADHEVREHEPEPVQETRVPDGTEYGSEAILHDEPQGALPETDGEDHTASLGDVDIVNDTDVFEMADDALSPENPSIMTQGAADIVSEFQRSAAARTLMDGGPKGGESNGDIAQAAEAYLAKTAGAVFTRAEQDSLIHESPGTQASNTDRLDIVGTHYADLEQMDDGEDDALWLM